MNNSPASWRVFSANLHKLKHVLVDTIKNLRLREDELSINEKGIKNRLDEINAQKRKLADDWVIRNMDSAKFSEIQHNLEKEEARLRSILAKCDPAQLKELEHTTQNQRLKAKTFTQNRLF